MSAFASADELAQALRRGLHRDMARASMHPVLGHVLAQLTGSPGPMLNAFHRRLYEPFERLRQTRRITFREFIASDPQAAALLRKCLGADQYTLATELGGAAYFEARSRVLASLRGNAPPIAQWMSWGHWGPGPISVPDVDMPRLVPVDFPVRVATPDGGVAWKYPDFGTGRKRLFQHVGYAELVERLPVGADIALDATPSQLLASLALPHDAAPTRCRNRSDLNLSTLQVVHMLATGQPPPIRSVIVLPGSPPPPGFRLSEGISGRTAEDARWELASRLGDPELVNRQGFARRIEGPEHGRAAADTSRRTDGNPDHPVTTLSNAELVAIARNDHGCVQIATRAVEVNHVRGQRSVRMLTSLLVALQPVVDIDLIGHLCGLCDPHNLRVVTPEGHAAEDFFAYFFGRQRNRYNPNTYRLPHLAGTPRPPRAVGPYDPELIDPGSWSTTFDEHEDYPASVNVFFTFSPYYLEPVAQILGQPEVRRAIEMLPASASHVAEAYNHLAGCINAAMRAYEMDPALMPRLFYQGAWR